MRRLALLLVSGSGGVAVSWAVAQHSLLGSRWHFVLLIVAWVPLWLLAGWAAVRVRREVSLVLVLLIAVALRIASATGTTPSISNDLYRYTWNAHVQLAGLAAIESEQGRGSQVRNQRGFAEPECRRHRPLAPGTRRTGDAVDTGMNRFEAPLRNPSVEHGRRHSRGQRLRA